MAPREGSGAVISAIGSIGIAAVIGYVVLAARLGVAFAIPVGIVGAVALMVALRGPLGQALGNRIQGIDPAPALLPPAELLNELDELRGRVAELEERVDFSERLLAQARDGMREGGTPP